MKKLLLFALLSIHLFAHNESYYNGLAKNYCKQAIVQYVDNNARHEYWFNDYKGSFFKGQEFAYSTAMFWGDNLKIKTPLGSFARYRYVCIYRTDMEEVILLHVEKANDLSEKYTGNRRSPIRR